MTATVVSCTPQQMYDIACYAVRTDQSHTWINWEERVDAAYCAVAVLVWSSTSPPSRRDLVFAARKASTDVVGDEMRHHGLDKRSATFGEQRRNFARYWTDIGRDPLDDRVVDRISLAQIWGALTETDQEALAGLALWRDYSRAADELGLQYNTFCKRVRVARNRFLRLWHEGERPSSLWGRDKLCGRENSLTAVRVFRRRQPSIGRYMDPGGTTEPTP